MAYTVMAYIIMANIVMAYIGLYSYGLASCGWGRPADMCQHTGPHTRLPYSTHVHARVLARLLTCAMACV